MKCKDTVQNGAGDRQESQPLTEEEDEEEEEELQEQQQQQQQEEEEEERAKLLLLLLRPVVVRFHPASHLKGCGFSVSIPWAARLRS